MMPQELIIAAAAISVLPIALLFSFLSKNKKRTKNEKKERAIRTKNRSNRTEAASHQNNRQVVKEQKTHPINPYTKMLMDYERCSIGLSMDMFQTASKMRDAAINSRSYDAKNYDEKWSEWH